MSDETTSGLTACSERMRQLYWQEKDLPEALKVAVEGIRGGESDALDDPAGSSEILSLVKRLCYDVASFTWPGWDEPGIVPTPNDLILGTEMARKNLRYAIQLNKGDLPTSRAYWMVGAHLLSAGRYAEAVAEFEEAETYAQIARAIAEVSLSRGFVTLAQVLSGDSNLAQVLTEQLSVMDADATTASFAEQIRTAARVFGISGLLES